MNISTFHAICAIFLLAFFYGGMETRQALTATHIEHTFHLRVKTIHRILILFGSRAFLYVLLLLWIGIAGSTVFSSYTRFAACFTDASLCLLAHSFSFP